MAALFVSVTSGSARNYILPAAINPYLYHAHMDRTQTDSTGKPTLKTTRANFANRRHPLAEQSRTAER